MLRLAILAPAESRSSPLTKSRPTLKPSRAQGFGGGNLGGDDSFGVGNAAAVHEFSVFAEGDVGRDGVDVSGKDEVGSLAGDAGIDIPAGGGGGALDGAAGQESSRRAQPRAARKSARKSPTAPSW